MRVARTPKQGTIAEGGTGRMADKEDKDLPGAGTDADEPMADGAPERAPREAGRRPFGRSARALALLGAALRDETRAAIRERRERRAAAKRAAAADTEPAESVAEPVDAAPEPAPSAEPVPVAGTPSRRRRTILRGFAAALAIWAVLVIAVFWWALAEVPWREIADGTLKPVVVLENMDGGQLVQQGPYQGAYATVDQFPDHLVDAVLAIEDRRFYEHSGIDLRGIARAFMRNLSAGQVVQGGSTITQQLVKILYLEQDRTYRRKLQELVISVWLEARLGKDEILTRYLNNIYLGAGATGVPAAARVYFDKEPDELDLSESALIAGLIRAPSALNPLTNPDGARDRAQVVLGAMVASGRLDQAAADAARLEFSDLTPTRPAARSGSWFADWVMTEAREIAGPYRGTIRVRTTLAPELQDLSDRLVRDMIAQEGPEAGVTQGALVAMTPDGAVVAMTGGVDYVESSFNRAVQARRQPGSAFKLFVYYAALKAGIDPGMIVTDGPIEIDGWTPQNYGGDYYGDVSVAEAFMRSMNGAAVVIADAIGIDKVVEAARELGIDADLTPTPALALGASEVTLLDLTGAFASVRAGRAPVEPWGVQTFRAGEEARGFRVGPQVQPEIDISRYQRDMIGLLQLAVEHGTGRAAQFGAFAAGKTGTSQNHRDAWFVGFGEQLVVGVWVGNDDGTPMNRVTGGNLPARIWSAFMQEAVFGDGTETGSAEARVTGNRQTEGAVSCNVQACSRQYRSFRAEDCTYQPYGGGPRRLCER
jgi:penicillin-binding protein 1A